MAEPPDPKTRRGVGTTELVDKAKQRVEHAGLLGGFVVAGTVGERCRAAAHFRVETREADQDAWRGRVGLRDLRAVAVQPIEIEDAPMQPAAPLADALARDPMAFGCFALGSAVANLAHGAEDIVDGARLAGEQVSRQDALASTATATAGERHGKVRIARGVEAPARDDCARQSQILAAAGIARVAGQVRRRPSCHIRDERPERS